MQRVLEKLNIKKVMAVVGNEDAEGIYMNCGVQTSCKKEPYVKLFWKEPAIIISIEPCLFQMFVIIGDPNVLPVTICICVVL